jgi:hypothetical protein
MRTVLILGFTAGAMALALACSESNSGTNNGASSGASGTNSSGGTSGTSGASSSSGSGFRACSIAGAKASKCTDAEIKAYDDCIATKCDAKYKECYGADYKSGAFSGPCGTWISCTQKCACDDTQCMLKCPMDNTCTTCASGVGSCSDDCTVPECLKPSASSSGDGGNTSGGTCADLKACCDKMPAGQVKDACVQGETNAAGDDATCGQYYSGFKSFCS